MARHDSPIFLKKRLPTVYAVGSLTERWRTLGESKARSGTEGPSRMEPSFAAPAFGLEKVVLINARKKRRAHKFKKQRTAHKFKKHSACWSAVPHWRSCGLCGLVHPGLLGDGAQAVRALRAPGLALAGKIDLRHRQTGGLGCGRGAVDRYSRAGSARQRPDRPSARTSCRRMRKSDSTMNIAIGWSLARWRSASFGRRTLRSGAWKRRTLLVV